VRGRKSDKNDATWLWLADLLALEMDYWNFFAERLGDRNGAGKPAYNNYASFSRATDNAVALETAIAPLQEPALDQQLDTDTPMFGRKDWRGVTFESTVPSRFSIDQTVVIRGHVTASDRSDFNQIGLGFWKVNAETPVNFFGTINRAGDFAVSVRFTDSKRGAYQLSVYLYWPSAGRQYPRSSVSTITVE
jgi:hypothetical protein